MALPFESKDSTLFLPNVGEISQSSFLTWLNKSFPQMNLNVSRPVVSPFVFYGENSIYAPSPAGAIDSFFTFGQNGNTSDLKTVTSTEILDAKKFYVGQLTYQLRLLGGGALAGVNILGGRCTLQKDANAKSGQWSGYTGNVSIGALCIGDVVSVPFAMFNGFRIIGSVDIFNGVFPYLNVAFEGVQVIASK